MHLPNIESIGRSYDHVYLSAHMDDAVMSCGGRMAAQIENGESVLVVTVFTGEKKIKKKPGPYSTLMDTTHRRIEDERAMEHLCADYLWLDYLDSIFRYTVPFRRYRLCVEPGKSERLLEKTVFTDIGKICKATGARQLYCPLGVGQHVDHHILFSIGRRMLKGGLRQAGISFYEDIPYALYPNMLTYRMRLIGMNDKKAVAVNPLTWEKPLWQEVREVYRAVVNVPTLGLNRPLLKPVAFVCLLFSVAVLKYVRRPGVATFHGCKPEPEIIDVTRVMNKKMAAVLTYRSQLQDIFENRDAITRSLAVYSRAMGGNEGQYLERYWKMCAQTAPC